MQKWVHLFTSVNFKWLSLLVKTLSILYLHLILLMFKREIKMLKDHHHLQKEDLSYNQTLFFLQLIAALLELIS
jgi:hypothetical protein